MRAEVGEAGVDEVGADHEGDGLVLQLIWTHVDDWFNLQIFFNDFNCHQRYDKHRKIIHLRVSGYSCLFTISDVTNVEDVDEGDLVILIVIVEEESARVKL